MCDNAGVTLAGRQPWAMCGGCSIHRMFCLDSSVRVVNEKERERRRHENRGAEGAEGAGSVEGVSSSPIGEGCGEGLCSVQRKFFDFFSGNGAFWCILGACFNVSIRRVK